MLDRRVRILELLVGAGGTEVGSRRLCDVCAEITGTAGAGIMLMSGDVPRGSLCTTNAVSALIEELQYSFGEGPCVDAYEQRRPVLEPDLGAPRTSRWPAFTGPARDAGVGAVFGFPLQVGAARLGALDLYLAAPGHLSEDQYADALVMADIAAETVLFMQANAPPGLLAVELEAGTDFKFVVHQAAGMVAAQLDGTVANALIRLRAYAFASDRRLIDVAHDVISCVLRFDDRDTDA